MMKMAIDPPVRKQKSKKGLDCDVMMTRIRRAPPDRSAAADRSWSTGTYMYVLDSSSLPIP